MNMSAEQYRNLTTVPKNRRGQALAVAKAHKTAQLIAELKAPLKRNKFNAKRTQVDGQWFDSKREAAVYAELKLREKAGEIRQLVVHPKYELHVDGELVCKYTADFSYFTSERFHVVDVKSPATAKKRDFVIVCKLMRAKFKVDVEVIH